MISFINLCLEFSSFCQTRHFQLSHPTMINSRKFCAVAFLEKVKETPPKKKGQRSPSVAHRVAYRAAHRVVNRVAHRVALQVANPSHPCSGVQAFLVARSIAGTAARSLLGHPLNRSLWSQLVFFPSSSFFLTAWLTDVPTE